MISSLPLSGAVYTFKLGAVYGSLEFGVVILVKRWSSLSFCFPHFDLRNWQMLGVTTASGEFLWRKTLVYVLAIQVSKHLILNHVQCSLYFHHILTRFLCLNLYGEELQVPFVAIEIHRVEYGLRGRRKCPTFPLPGMERRVEERSLGVEYCEEVALGPFALLYLTKSWVLLVGFQIDVCWEFFALAFSGERGSPFSRECAALRPNSSGYIICSCHQI